MKERLQRQLHPEVRKALAQAQRLAGKEPVIKQVPPLPGDTRARLIRPLIPNRPYEIQVVQGQERTLDHLITHEIGHIVRLHQVPEAERLAPAIRPGTRAVTAQQVLPNLERLLRQGLAEEAVVDLFTFWSENLVAQLANFPADLRIEQWMHDRFPGLRPIQRRSLTQEVERGYPAFHPVVAEQTPAAFYHPTMAMNAAQALHTVELTNTPSLAAPYEEHGYGPIGRHLLQLALSPADEGHRGDMLAVNAWAETLQLTGWYLWQPLHMSR